jgi:hypothetical protein
LQGFFEVKLKIFNTHFSKVLLQLGSSAASILSNQDKTAFFKFICGKTIILSVYFSALNGINSNFRNLHLIVPVFLSSGNEHQINNGIIAPYHGQYKSVYRWMHNSPKDAILGSQVKQEQIYSHSTKS